MYSFRLPREVTLAVLPLDDLATTAPDAAGKTCSFPSARYACVVAVQTVLLLLLSSTSKRSCRCECNSPNAAKPGLRPWLCCGGCALPRFASREERARERLGRRQDTSRQGMVRMAGWLADDARSFVGTTTCSLSPSLAMLFAAGPSPRAHPSVDARPPAAHLTGHVSEAGPSHG